MWSNTHGWDTGEKATMWSNTSGLGARRSAFTTSNNLLAGKLWDSLQPEHSTTDGFFVSPFSITAAVLLLTNGATNQTQQELMDVLGIRDLVAVNKEAEQILRAESSLLVANSVWLHPRLQVQSSYKSSMAQHLKSTVETLDSIEKVNAWCSDKTLGKIPKILDKMPPDAAVLILNALYFKGKWKHEFPKQQTQADFFTTPQNDRMSCDMMHLRASDDSKLRYMDTAEYQAIQLPYKKNTLTDLDLAAIVVLPKLGLSATQLDFDSIVQQVSIATQSKGLFQMPKFKIESSMDLTGNFKSIGAKKVFQMSYDLAPLVENMPLEGLKVTQMIHKTVVEVDEEGTVAAAVTTIAVAGFGFAPPPEPIFHMRCDRPFYFLICNGDTIVFLGKVNRPAESLLGEETGTAFAPAPTTSAPFSSNETKPMIPLPKRVQDLVDNADTIDRAFLTSLCNKDALPLLNKASKEIVNFKAGISNVASIEKDLLEAYQVFSFILFQWHYHFGEAFPYAYYNLACVHSLLIELLLLEYKAAEPNSSALSVEAWNAPLPPSFAGKSIPPLQPFGALRGSLIESRFRAAQQALQIATITGYKDTELMEKDRDLLAYRELQSRFNA